MPTVVLHKPGRKLELIKDVLESVALLVAQQSIKREGGNIMAGLQD